METLEKLVYNIAENVGMEHNAPFLERLRFMVQYYRATLIRRDDAKGRKLDSNFLQIYKGKDLEGVRMIEEAGNDCLLLRSEERIPKMVRLLSGDALRAVTSIDGSTIFSPVEYEAVRTLGFGKWTGKEQRHYFRDGYLYIINSMVERVHVEAAFEDPMQIDTTSYPVPMDFVQQITQAILNGELRRVMIDPTSDDVTING